MEGNRRTPRALERVIDEHLVSASRKACEARQRLGNAFLEGREQEAFQPTIIAAQAALEEAESELSDWQAVKTAILATDARIAS